MPESAQRHMELSMCQCTAFITQSVLLFVEDGLDGRYLNLKSIPFFET